MSINARIFIARHERYEAAEAYAERLTPEQREFLLDNECDFWFHVNAEGPNQLLAIADEG